jgi:hypothetical protein
MKEGVACFDPKAVFGVVTPFKRFIEFRCGNIQESYGEPGGEKTETVSQKVFRREVTLEDFQEFTKSYLPKKQFVFADETYIVQKSMKHLEASNDPRFSCTETLLVIAVTKEVLERSKK